MPDVKFNIYYSTSENGPWTLSNSTPLDIDLTGNEYTVTGLKSQTTYHLLIVGGILNENDEFTAFITQHIGPEGSEVLGVGAVKTKTFTARTFAPKIETDALVGMQFEISAII